MGCFSSKNPRCNLSRVNPGIDLEIGLPSKPLLAPHIGVESPSSLVQADTPDRDRDIDEAEECLPLLPQDDAPGHDQNTHRNDDSNSEPLREELAEGSGPDERNPPDTMDCPEVLRSNETALVKEESFGPRCQKQQLKRVGPAGDESKASRYDEMYARAQSALHESDIRDYERKIGRRIALMREQMQSQCGLQTSMLFDEDPLALAGLGMFGRPSCSASTLSLLGGGREAGLGELDLMADIGLGRRPDIGLGRLGLSSNSRGLGLYERSSMMMPLMFAVTETLNMTMNANRQGTRSDPFLDEARNRLERAGLHTKVQEAQESLRELDKACTHVDGMESRFEAMQGSAACEAKDAMTFGVDCVELRLVFARLAKIMFLSGIFTWMTAPLTAAGVYFFSTCSGGWPFLYYAALSLKVVVTLASGLYGVNVMRLGLEAIPPEVGPVVARVKTAFSEAYEFSSSNVSKSRLDYWRILIIFGLLSTVDLETDGTLMGQIHACETEDHNFNAQYVDSFHIPVLKQAVSFLRLHGLFAILLIVTYVHQGLRGMVLSYNLWSRLCDSSEDDIYGLLGQVEETALWASMNYASSVTHRTLMGFAKLSTEAAEQAVTDAEEEFDNAEKCAYEAAAESERASAHQRQYEQIGVILDAAGDAVDPMQMRMRLMQHTNPFTGMLFGMMNHHLCGNVPRRCSQRLSDRNFPLRLRQAANEREEGELDAYVRWKLAKADEAVAFANAAKALKAAEVARIREREEHAAATRATAAHQAATFREVRDVVLMENTPSLVLTIGFFCLRLHAKDPLNAFGSSKVLASAGLSAGSAIFKAQKVARLGCTGFLMFSAVSSMVLFSAIKTIAAFTCASGFFSMMTLRCDAVA